MMYLPLIIWPQMSTGESLLFSLIALVMVIAAIGILCFQKATYSVLCMVLVMLCLSILYFILQAPFNASVQIIVYTGAIMMLFLFVIMMIGLNASDDYKLQRKTYISSGVLLGILLAVAFFALFLQYDGTSGDGFTYDAYSNSPIVSLATTLISEHWLTVELSAMLLVTAAIGTLFLTHSDRLGPKYSQREVALTRMKGMKEGRTVIWQRPAPGVWAHSNAVDNPAISGETLEPIPDSIPRVLHLGGFVSPDGRWKAKPDAADLAAIKLVEDFESNLVMKDKVGASLGDVTTGRSASFGMPGKPAPVGLIQIGEDQDEEGN